MFDSFPRQARSPLDLVAVNLRREENLSSFFFVPRKQHGTMSTVARMSTPRTLHTLHTLQTLQTLHTRASIGRLPRCCHLGGAGSVANRAGLFVVRAGNNKRAEAEAEAVRKALQPNVRV